MSNRGRSNRGGICRGSGKAFIRFCIAAGLISNTSIREGGADVTATGGPEDRSTMEDRVRRLADRVDVEGKANAWMAYIDKEYTVRYINPPMIRSGWADRQECGTVDLREMLGRTCYKVFRGRESVCPDCALDSARCFRALLSRITRDGWGGPMHIYTIPDFDEGDRAFRGVLELGLPVTEYDLAEEDAAFLDLVGEPPEETKSGEGPDKEATVIHLPLCN